MGEDTESAGLRGDVLVVGDGPLDPRGVASAVEPTEGGGDVNGVFVAVDHTPDAALACWRSLVGVEPARFGVVAVGETTRSSVARGDPSAGSVDARSVVPVSDPGAVDDVGHAVMDYLDRWPPGDVVLVVDALADVVEATTVETVFRFLHVVTTLLDRSGGGVVAYLDAGAVDAQTVGTLRPLFDAVYDERSP